MAPKRLYPRSTIKKIIKAHSSRGLSKNADLLIFLDFTLFVQDLVEEASMSSKMKNQKGITAESIREVTAKSLMKFKC